MSAIVTILEALRNASEDSQGKSVTTTVKAGLKNKKVKVSIAGIVAIAVCGAAGYALTRPTNRRRISRYADQLSGYLPGLPRKTSRTERLANQIADLVDGAFRR